MRNDMYIRQQLLMYIWLYAPQYSFLAMKVSEQVNNMWPNKLLQLPTFALLLLLNCSSSLLLYVFELISYFYEYVCIVLHSHTQHQQQLYIWCKNHIASLITFQATYIARLLVVLIVSRIQHLGQNSFRVSQQQNLIYRFMISIIIYRIFISSTSWPQIIDKF